MFVGENESEDVVRAGLIKFLPCDFEKEKLCISKKQAVGFGERKIIIFDIFLEKERHSSAVLSSLLGLLDDSQKRKIFRQLESRLDNDLFFFLRFDKESLIKENKLVLTDEGNCYHFRMCVAAYPKKMDVALKMLKELFNVKDDER